MVFYFLELGKLKNNINLSFGQKAKILLCDKKSFLAFYSLLYMVRSIIYFVVKEKVH